MTTTALLAGLAQMLEDAGLGVFDPGRPFTATETAIVVQAVPSQPDNLIVLSPYLTRDDPSLNDTLLGIQFRVRATSDPRVVLDRDDAIFDLFQGMTNTVVNGVPVVAMWRQQSGLTGQDQNQRWERYSSYYLNTAMPTQHRVD